MKTFRKLLAGTALFTLISGAAFAGPGPQTDEKRAHDLYVLAGEADQRAVQAHKAGVAAWETWRSELRRMHTARAEARRLRSEGARFNRAADRLFRAEHLRGEALDDRLTADVLLRRAHDHELAANGFAASIAAGQRDLNDLGTNPVFASAVADLKKDVAINQKKEADERAAAKAERDAAAQLEKDAAALEQQAAGLEKPVVPPPVIDVVKPRPAGSVVAPP